MDSSQDSDLIITNVVSSLTCPRNPTTLSDHTIDLNSSQDDDNNKSSSIELLSTPNRNHTTKLIPGSSLVAKDESDTDSQLSLSPILPKIENPTTENLKLNQPEPSIPSRDINPRSSPLKTSSFMLSMLSSPDRTPSPTPEAKPKNTNSMVRTRSESESSSDESIFSRPSPAKQQKSINSAFTPKSSSLLNKTTRPHRSAHHIVPKQNLKITDFFSKFKSTAAKKPLPPNENDILDDILKTTLEEEDYFKDLDKIQELQAKAKHEQEETRIRYEQEALFKKQFSAELALRFQANPDATVGLPHSLVDPEGHLKPIPNSQTVYPLNFEEELKINLAFYKNNGSSLILDQSSSDEEGRNRDSMRETPDFYFFQPQFRQQHYELSPQALRTLPKNTWYSFLSTVETPNLLIESGVLLARIRANKLKNGSVQPLPFVIWKWIMCNSLRSKLLLTHYQQYRDCLVEGHDTCASTPPLLSLTLQTMFLMIGGNPDIVTAIFKPATSDSIKCDIQDSFQHVLSPKGHDYLPQAAAVELMVDVAVKIMTEMKVANASDMVNATFLAVVFASVDASLLSVSRTAFSSRHASPVVFFNSKLAELLDLIPAYEWENRKGSQSWAALCDLLVKLVPAQNYELRDRILVVLSSGGGVDGDRVKLLRICLAVRFLADAAAAPADDPAPLTVLAEFTPHTYLSDPNTIVSKVLLPSIDYIFSRPPPHSSSSCCCVPVLYKIHYMNYCLHNVSALSTDTARLLVLALERKADNLTRFMRVSNPEILLQIGILETTISSLRGRLPAYDVFSAV